ncbi:hypothetical protein SDC9_179160 [bioreactor metagenome]|uniref:Uncharacterized protein n=1 Tax=bioreactor metagenome TaxID=1076179 RepID=A0A645GZN4_9ZZZZ
MLGVELELVNLEAGKVFDQIQQRRQVRYPAARDVQHDATPGEIGVILNSQAWQAIPIFAQELAERSAGGAQTRDITIEHSDALTANHQDISLRFSGRFAGFGSSDRQVRMLLRAGHQFQYDPRFSSGVP